MAQTGYTPILIYSSSTASNTPSAGNLTNSTLGSELAINIADGKLFYKDSSNNVQVIGWKVVPTTAGGTGLTSYNQGDLLYYNSGTTLTALAKNTTATRYLANTGTNNNPAWAQIDLSNGVTGVLPVANGGTNASTASITAFNNITGYTASGATGTTSTNLVFSTSPSLTTPNIITSINDTNGNELIGVTATASAVNEITVANAATTNSPTISATGSDTDIGIRLAPKGTGDVTVVTGNVVIGTAGNGIDFSATSGTGTSELLDDYEEGTYVTTMTPETSGTITLNSSFNTLAYTKVGNVVTITGVVIPSASSSPTGGYVIIDLPFAVATLSEISERFSCGGAWYNGGATPPAEPRLARLYSTQGLTTAQVHMVFGTFANDSRCSYGFSFSYFAA